MYENKKEKNSTYLLIVIYSSKIQNTHELILLLYTVFFQFFIHTLNIVASWVTRIGVAVPVWRHTILVGYISSFIVNTVLCHSIPLNYTININIDGLTNITIIIYFCKKILARKNVIMTTFRHDARFKFSSRKLSVSMKIIHLSISRVYVVHPRTCKRSDTLYQKSLLLFSTWREYFYSQPTHFSSQPKK